MKRLMLCLIILVTALVLASQVLVHEQKSASAIGSWSTPQPISDDPHLDRRDVRLTATQDGTVHAVWADNTLTGGSRYEIIYAQKPPDGAWTPPTVVSSTTGNAKWPEVTSGPSNSIHVVWVEPDSGSLVYRSRDACGNWSAASGEVFFNGPVNPSPPAIVVEDDGTVHVVWEEGTSGPASYRRRDAGGTWRPIEAVTPPGSDSEQPSIAVTADRKVHVLWGEGYHGPQLMYASKGLGGAWSAPQVVWSEVGHEHPVVLAGTDGRLHVTVAHDSNSPTPGIYYHVRYIDGTWSGPLKVDDTGIWDGPQDMTWLSGGNIAVVWSGSHSTGDPYEEIWYAEVSPSGSWSVPSQILGPGERVSWPNIASAPGVRDVVAYSAPLAPPSDVYYSERCPSGACGTQEWQTTSPLLDARVFHSVFVAPTSDGAYLYATGGQAGAWPPIFPLTTERAAILADGCLGPWQVVQGASLPGVRRLTNAVNVDKNGYKYVYLVGGWDEWNHGGLASTVRARILSNGTLDHEGTSQPVWEEMSSQLGAPRVAHAVVSVETSGHTYLYAIGGTTVGSSDAFRTVERSEVRADGSLTPWEIMASHLVQPEGLTSMAAYVANQYIYVVGGSVGGQDGNPPTGVVQRARVGEDGTLEPFYEVAEPWPSPSHYEGWVATGGRLYLLGGMPSGTIPYVLLDNVDVAQLDANGMSVWEEGPSLNVPRQQPVGACYQGRIYAVAGRDSQSDAGGRVVEVLGASGACSAETTPTPTATYTPVPPTPTRTQTPVPPTATRTHTPHPTAHGVGGAVLLPPAAIAAESGGTSGGSGLAVATWIALAGIAGALGLGGLYARSHRRSR